MKTMTLLATLLAGPALAGDSTAPGPVELLIPTVIETADLGPYVPGMALSLQGGSWGDDELRRFVFDGPPISEVPLPAAGWLLVVALSALAAAGAGRASAPVPPPPEPTCQISPLAPLTSPRPRPNPRLTHEQ